MKKLSVLKNYFMLIGIYIFIYIPIAYLRFPDIRNELKYLVITKHMFLDKNFFILKYFSELYPDKPPLYFWILGFCNLISSKNFFTLAIIFGSTLPSLIIVILTYKFLKNLVGEKRSFNIGFTLATLPFFLGTSVFLRMDILMSLFICSSLYLFFSFYYGFLKSSYLYLIVFYLIIFLGVFTKGIAGFIVPLGVILVFLFLEKNIKFLKKLKFSLGILELILLTFLWLAFVYFSAEGKDYLALMLGRETIGRIVQAKTHIKPFYYYIYTLILLLLPYSFMFLVALFHTLKNIKFWKNLEPLEKIGFVWSVIPLILFSLASGKLAIYLLPILPGTIFLTLSYFNGKKYIKLWKILKKVNLTFLIFLIFLLPIYNRLYSLQPFMNYITEKSIGSFKFSDSINLSYYREIPLKNYDDIKEISSLDFEYILTRNKYRKELSALKYDLILENKIYSLYKKREI